MVEVALFDIGGVIIRADHAITIHHLEEQGIPPEKAEQFFRNEGYSVFARGKITGEEFWRQLQTIIGVNWPLEDMIYVHDIHMYEVDEETVDVLKGLRERQVSLAFATDTNTWQTRRERELIDLREFASHFSRSDEIGRLKRDEGTFDHIARFLGNNPGEILFVDDRADLCALAQVAGFQTIRFENAQQLQNELDIFV